MSNDNALMTLAEKIGAHAAGLESVRPGQIVTCNVDLAMVHDSSGPRRIQPMLKEIGASLWDPSKVVLITDHFVPAFDAESAEILDISRKWAKSEGVENFYDMQGICHIVLPERGHLKPGMFVVGADSHSTTGGAFGALMVGIGSTEMAGVMATGEIWIRVPPTLRVEWSGTLGRGVAAKDIMLALCAKLGMGCANYKAIEFAGGAIDRMPMYERMVLSNMAAELGAKAGLIAPDAVTIEALATAGADTTGALGWQPDANAAYESVHTFVADTLQPQIAAPHSPENSAPAGEYTNVAINHAYIGACTGAKLSDLHMAAEILRGRKVAKGVRLLVAPASKHIAHDAETDGTIAALTEAGTVMKPSGCGACAGYGAGLLADGDVCISSTARNFQGRMGHPGSRVYLGSAYSVAAAAVAGKIVDPRDMLQEMAA